MADAVTDGECRDYLNLTISYLSMSIFTLSVLYWAQGVLCCPWVSYRLQFLRLLSEYIRIYSFFFFQFFLIH